MAHWKVCSLDVWGNEEDGYEVNDWFPVDVVEFNDNATDGEIWNELVSSSIARGAFSQAEFDSWGEGFIEIREAETHKPVFHLYRVEED